MIVPFHKIHPYTKSSSSGWVCLVRREHCPGSGISQGSCIFLWHTAFHISSCCHLASPNLRGCWGWLQNILSWWRLRYRAHFGEDRNSWMLAAGKLLGLNPLAEPRATLCVSCQQLHQKESFVSEAAYHVTPFRAWHRYVSSWVFFFPVRKKMWSWIRRIAVSWHSSYSFLQDTLCSRPDAISAGEARVWFERSRQFVLLTSAGP